MRVEGEGPRADERTRVPFRLSPVNTHHLRLITRHSPKPRPLKAPGVALRSWGGRQPDGPGLGSPAAIAPSQRAWAAISRPKPSRMAYVRAARMTGYDSRRTPYAAGSSRTTTPLRNE